MSSRFGMTQSQFDALTPHEFICEGNAELCGE